MDHETQRKKRMEELEAKRKRLEEMRKLRKTRSSAETAPEIPVNTAATNERENVDDLVNSLLTDPVPVVVETVNETTETPEESVSATVAPLSRLELAKLRASELSTVTEVVRIDIAPKVIETYVKECQTEDSSFNEEDMPGSDESNHTPHRRARADSNTITSPIPSASSPVRERAKTLSAEEEAIASAMKQLSLEDVNTIMEGEGFQGFLSKSAHIMDRALGLSNAVDILKDYTGADKGRGDGDDRNAVMSLARTFTNSAAHNRPVMDVQANPHHSELFLVAYGSPTRKSHESSQAFAVKNPTDEGGGMVCVWSVILDDVPEFTFTSHSPVLTARFHPSDPHIIIGGCYSGQVVVWDTRVSSSRPTMRSNFAGKGHKHPIYSMCIERSNRSNAVLITASTDGTLCHWDMANLAEPLGTASLMGTVMAPPIPSAAHDSETILPLSAATGANARRAICASCMTLGPVEDSRKLVVGSEGGALCVFQLPFKPSAPFQQVAAHYGMITAVHINPSASKHFKYLALTSSVDWSIKMWDVSDISLSATPVLEFTASTFEYFSSVRWSHIHPGAFSCITSGGTVMLWNICQSVVEPVGTLKLNAGGGDKHSDGSGALATRGDVGTMNCALNKSVWLDDGRKMIVGDSRGNTFMVSIRPNAISLRAGDEERLESSLHLNSTKIMSSISSSRGMGSVSLDNEESKSFPSDGGR